MIAVILFFITLVFIIWQPRGLKIGTIAVVGAIISFAAGTVNLQDVFTVVHIVWDATLAFIGIIILSMALDEIGFFEWCAIKMANLSRGNGNYMFVLSLLLGSCVSALFANDGAALILTPILLAKMRILKLNEKTILSFVLAGGFISDSASLPFVFSNLTNIVTVDFFHVRFFEYFLTMGIPYLVSTVFSIALLWLILRKDIPKQIDIGLLKNADDVLKNKKLFYLSWIFLFVLLISYFIGDFYHIPVSVFALGGGLLFLLLSSYFKVTKPVRILKEAPWQIVWFSVGLYIVVYGLKNAGLTEFLSHIISYFAGYGNAVLIVATGFISAILSSVMNNMPTIMIMNIATHSMPNELLKYANIIGANLGPKMTPFGSLATLLWLHILSQKGIKISYARYCKFGIIITPPILLIVLLSLLAQTLF